MTDQELLDILAWRDQGATQIEMARRIGVPAQNIRKALVRIDQESAEAER